jgi:hypothetical protein
MMTTAGGTMAALGRRTVLAMAIGAAGLAGGLAGPARAAAGDLVDLQVVDRETGQVMPVWRHGGRMYVAGRTDARYSLRLTNNSDGRVLVVASVDGVNIISGETASYGQTGYVLHPYQTYDVSGWRKSNAEVAAFTFSAQSQSYAAQTGRPLDVGVIGIAVFKEKYVPPPVAYAPPPVAAARDSAASNTVSEMVVQPQARRAAPAASIPPLPVPPVEHRIQEPAPPPSRPAGAGASLVERLPERPSEHLGEKLGTGHGAREASYVHNVDFERATPYPQLIRRIEYDSYENLVASGVIPRSWDRVRPPRAFPGSDGQRYVPDPPGGR